MTNISFNFCDAPVYREIVPPLFSKSSIEKVALKNQIYQAVNYYYDALSDSSDLKHANLTEHVGLFKNLCNEKDNMEFSFLRHELENMPEDEFISLGKWLSLLDNKCDGEISKHYPDYKMNFISSTKTNVLIHMQEEMGAALPLHLSLFHVQKMDSNISYPTRKIYPSIIHAMDIFKNDWYQSIDNAFNAAAKSVIGTEWHEQNGFIVRWLLDLSRYNKKTFNIADDDLKRVDDIKKVNDFYSNITGRVLGGSSAGAAFALGIMQLLARAKLRHPNLFQAPKT